jgi:hypothetical protein
MPRVTAKCELCHAYVLDEADGVFLRPNRDDKGVYLTPTDLKGREPWAGIRCVCRPCARTVGMAAGLAKVTITREAAK